MKCLQNSCTKATISDSEDNSYTCNNEPKFLNSLTNDAPKKKKVIRILDLGRSKKKKTHFTV